MSDQKLRVLIEGPNCVGKTTIAKTISQELNLNFYEPFKNQCELYKLWFSNPIKALNESIELLADMPRRGVFDRFHLTPQTMINHPLQFLPLISPNDVTFLLNASSDVLKHREKLRGEPEEVDPEHFYKPHYERLGSSWNACCVDTSDLDIESVCELIINRIRDEKNNKKILINEGRSKLIYRVGDKLLVQLKPSLHSFTYEKKENIPGTEVLRNIFYEKAIKILKQNDLPVIDYQKSSKSSYTCEYCYSLPFEFIVKMRAVGTTLVDCPGLFYPNMPFPQPVVRFDFRCEPRDIAVPAGYLDNFGLDSILLGGMIKKAALVLDEWFKEANYELVDICFVLGYSRSGQLKIISEISPDCMRVRKDNKSYDKDLFRFGESSSMILDSWAQLIEDLS